MVVFLFGSYFHALLPYFPRIMFMKKAITRG